MNQINFDDEFERLYAELRELKPGTGAYNQVLENINVLSHIEQRHKEEPAKSKMDKFLNNGPLVSSVFMSVLGFATLYHERAEVITSRIWSWIRFR